MNRLYTKFCEFPFLYDKNLLIIHENWDDNGLNLSNGNVVDIYNEYMYMSIFRKGFDSYIRSIIAQNLSQNNFDKLRVYLL